MSMKNSHAPTIGGNKLAGMLLVTWLTFPFFIGLGNLVWLWNDIHYRRRASIALGLSLGNALVVTILVGPLVMGWALILSLVGIPPGVTVLALVGAPFMMPVIGALPLGMAIWMTIDAVRAYRAYKLGE